MSDQNVAGSWEGKASTIADEGQSGALGGFGWTFLLVGIAACIWALASPSGPSSSSVVNVGMLTAKGVWASLGGAFTVAGAVMVSAQSIIATLRERQ